MKENDLTPLIEAGKKHIKGFAEYKYRRCFLAHTTCPYTYAKVVIKHENWDQYLERAIAIVYESKDMDEFNEKMHELNNTFPDEWRDFDVVYL